MESSYLDPVLYIEISAIILVVLTVFIIVNKGKIVDSKYKKLVFLAFVIPVLLSTFYLAGFTVHKNLNSETKGPVHWHADFEIWVCGEKIDLVNPTGLANKIGTPLFHEHNDDRIHVEGTVNRVEDVNIGAFFKTVGGDLTTTSFKYPTSDGRMIDVTNGDNCGEQEGELKVYVNGVKNDNPADYMYYPHSGVPPGDCIIVEFGSNLEDTTDRVCNFWAANDWNYENYKELRKEPVNRPVWDNEDWQYIDGQGMVRVGGNQ